MVKRLVEEWDEQTSSMRQRWVRGPSVLPKVFKQPQGSKLKLFWEGNHVVGPEKHPSLFSESIGVLMAKARNFDWKKHWEQQDQTSKESLWKEIEKFWEIDDAKKEVTLGKIASDEFRNKKSKWKKNNYTRYTTYEERVNHKPQQLTQQEWVDLVEFWDSPVHNVISERNKANRTKQVAIHTTGRISFPQLMNKISEEEGAPPYLGEFYVRTHISPRTNDTHDEVSRRNIEKMRDIAGVDDSGNQQPLTDEIYTQVMHPLRRRRVQLEGPGMTQSYFASQASTSRLNELEGELDEMRRIMQEKEEERKREIEEMKMQAQSEISGMRLQLQSQYEEMEARLVERLLNNVPLTNLLTTPLFGPDRPNS